MYIHKNEELGNWETPVIIAPYTELNLAIMKPVYIERPGVKGFNRNFVNRYGIRGTKP